MTVTASSGPHERDADPRLDGDLLQNPETGVTVGDPTKRDGGTRLAGFEMTNPAEACHSMLSSQETDAACIVVLADMEPMETWGWTKPCLSHN